MKSRINAYEKVLAKMPPAERERFKQALMEKYRETYSRDFLNTQELWIKVSLIILGKYFDFDEEKLLQFLGDWKMAYRSVNKFKTENEQDEYVETELKKLFPSGFPQEFIETMKENPVIYVGGVKKEEEK